MNNINFKKCAFHFMIWILIINVISFDLTISYTSLFNEQNNTGGVLFYFRILVTSLLLLSFIFIILTASRKRKRITNIGLQ
jgi:hypothetical protein